MAGFFKRFAKDGVLHGVRLLNDPVYREYCMLLTLLERKPRHQELDVRAGGFSLRIPDAASFLSTYKELFVEGIYKFRSSSPAPVIVDIGSNIGLSVLYFKKLFPSAKIFAYEADPYIFQFLKRNIEENCPDDGSILLERKAVWSCGGLVSFQGDKADGGRIVESKGECEAEALPIAELLDAKGRIDMLKIDAEGAENQMLPAAAGHLGSVERVFVEYHSQRDAEQRLDVILRTLKDAGFRIALHSEGAPARPFEESSSNAVFDLQANIFAVRLEAESKESQRKGGK